MREPVRDRPNRSYRAKNAHHALHVALLKDSRRVGRWHLYVGETKLDPDVRFDQHKTDYRASWYVGRFGVRYFPSSSSINPLRRWEAIELEPAPAEAFRHAGVPWVEGGR